MNDADQSWRSVPSWQAEPQQGYDYGQGARPPRDGHAPNDDEPERYSARFFRWIRESGLARSDDERWIGGVCGGLARYLGWSPLLVRALMIGAAFVGGAGLLFYVLAWLLLPERRDGRIMCEDLMAGMWDWSFLGVLLGFALLLFWPPVWLFGVVVGAFALWLSIELAGRRALRYAAHRNGPVAGYAPPVAAAGTAPRNMASATGPANRDDGPSPKPMAGDRDTVQPDGRRDAPTGAPANGPMGAAPIASAAVPPMMTSPYRPVAPAPRPRYVRRKPAGPLLVLAVVGLIFVSFAAMLTMWSDGVGDLESLLGDGLLWIGAVCVGLGLVIVVLGCMGRRSGGLTPFAWIAAILAMSMACAGIAYAMAYRWRGDVWRRYTAQTSSGLGSTLAVHGFGVIGSDEATMRRLSDGLAVEGDSVNDILHIDLTDFGTDDGHEVTLNDGTTAISHCPTGTIRLAPYRVTAMVTIPDGCSWVFSNANGTWWDYNDKLGGVWAVMASEYGDMVGSYFGDWDKGVYGDGRLETSDGDDGRDAGYYWPADQGRSNAPAVPELTIVVDSSIMGETVVQYESQNTLPTYKEWAESTEDDHE